MNYLINSYKNATKFIAKHAGIVPVVACIKCGNKDTVNGLNKCYDCALGNLIDMAENIAIKNGSIEYYTDQDGNERFRGFAQVSISDDTKGAHDMLSAIECHNKNNAASPSPSSAPTSPSTVDNNKKRKKKARNKKKK